jgi:quinol monooxygenase YgiN
LGGIASLATISSLNVAVQTATPSWVRARVLAIYMIVFQGAIAVGSVVWGVLAWKTNVRLAFALSGATMLLGAFAARRWFPLSTRVPDFSPSLHWPKPVLVCQPAAEDGPVLVMLEYRVAPKNQSKFMKAAQHVRRLRRRDGAYQWDLFRDPSDPERLLEIYMVDSWAAHLRQHERLTVEEREAENRLAALATSATRPRVTHLISAQPLSNPEPAGASKQGISH